MLSRPVRDTRYSEPCLQLELPLPLHTFFFMLWTLRTFFFTLWTLHTFFFTLWTY